MLRPFLILFLFPLSLFAGDTLRPPAFIFKTNLVSMAVYKVLAVQAEHNLGDERSLCMTLTWMPDRPYFDSPWAGFNAAGQDADGHYSGFAVTPEFRVYTGLHGKIPPCGFYFSGYLRAVSYRFINHFTYNGSEYFDEQYDYRGVAIGGMIGRQWVIRDKLTIDWWMFGFHYGLLTGSGVTVTGDYITRTREEMTQDYLDDPPPIGHYTDPGLENGNVHLKWKGAWYGIRTGVSIGYMF